MRLSLKYVVALSTLILLFTNCNSNKENKTQNQRNRGPVSVDAFVVEPHSISDNIEVPGSLLPFEETHIRTEVSGRIVQLNINEGATVSKGSLLLKLFDQDLQAQLKKLQVQLKIKEKTADRNLELVKISGISQQDYDLSSLDVENLKADIDATKIAISKTEIRAPYTGKVGLRNVSLGSYLSPTDIITTLRQVEKLKLEFSVPEKYARDITKGYIVKFKVDQGNDFHRASVLATENSVDQNTRTLKIRAVVNESHPELIPGVFAKVHLQLGKNMEALLIPTQAVIPQARDKKVILLRKDSVQFTTIETGIRDSVYIQIVTGLNVGDTIITSGLMAIRPHSVVKVLKVTRYK